MAFSDPQLCDMAPSFPLLGTDLRLPGPIMFLQSKSASAIITEDTDHSKD